MEIPPRRAACNFGDSGRCTLHTRDQCENFSMASNHGICGGLIGFSQPARRLQRNVSVPV